MFLVYRADDGCFYVGLGSNGKKGKSGGPAEYRPFQCCPTKLEKSTRVPKMTAAKIGQSQSGGRKAGGNFKFATPTKAPATAVSKEKATTSSSAKGKDKKPVNVPEMPTKRKTKTPDVDTKTDNKKKEKTSNKQNKGGKADKGKGLFSIDLNWW